MRPLSDRIWEEFCILLNSSSTQNYTKRRAELMGLYNGVVELERANARSAEAKAEEDRKERMTERW